MALSIGVRAQENDRAELVYTQRLSKQFPDSAFLLLKEMYEQSLSRKDRLGTGICLQQMGQICYYLGNFPKALDRFGMRLTGGYDLGFLASGPGYQKGTTSFKAMRTVPQGGDYGATTQDPNIDMGAFPTDGSGNKHFASSLNSK